MCQFHPLGLMPHETGVPFPFAHPPPLGLHIKSLDLYISTILLCHSGSSFHLFAPPFSGYLTPCKIPHIPTVIVYIHSMASHCTEYNFALPYNAKWISHPICPIIHSC